MERVIRVRVDGRVCAGAVRVSERTLTVAALFGLGVEREAERVLFDPVEMEIGGGDVVLVTGPSGAGKSTLLQRLTEEMAGCAGLRVMNIEEVALPADRSVIDCFPGTIEEAARHLARAGLAEAYVLLRAPAELSEGQRFRYRLAQFFTSDAEVLVADEFCATLDRVTARVVAHQVGKFVRGSVLTGRPRAVVVATTHEDLAEDLGPTVRVWKGLGRRVEVTRDDDKHEGH